jgi:hypothetical protein
MSLQFPYRQLNSSEPPDKVPSMPVSARSTSSEVASLGCISPFVADHFSAHGAHLAMEAALAAKEPGFFRKPSLPQKSDKAVNLGGGHRATLVTRDTGYTPLPCRICRCTPDLPCNLSNGDSCSRLLNDLCSGPGCAIHAPRVRL